MLSLFMYNRKNNEIVESLNKDHEDDIFDAIPIDHNCKLLNYDESSGSEIRKILLSLYNSCYFWSKKIVGNVNMIFYYGSV